MLSPTLRCQVNKQGHPEGATGIPALSFHGSRSGTQIHTDVLKDSQGPSMAMVIPGFLWILANNYLTLLHQMVFLENNVTVSRRYQ